MYSSTPFLFVLEMSFKHDCIRLHNLHYVWYHLIVAIFQHGTLVATGRWIERLLKIELHRLICQHQINHKQSAVSFQGCLPYVSWLLTNPCKDEQQKDEENKSILFRYAQKYCYRAPLENAMATNPIVTFKKELYLFIQKPSRQEQGSGSNWIHPLSGKPSATMMCCGATYEDACKDGHGLALLDSRPFKECGPWNIQEC